jgi:hypothetical protein
MVAKPIVENASSHCRATRSRSAGSGEAKGAMSMTGIRMAEG